MTVTSQSAVTLVSESPMVIIDLMSERNLISRGAAGVVDSLVVHHSLADLPGSSVASIVVRPSAVARRVIKPGSRRASAWLPGMSIDARLLPAAGTGKLKTARPASIVSDDATFKEAENTPGPVTIPEYEPPSRSNGNGFCDCRAS